MKILQNGILEPDFDISIELFRLEALYATILGNKHFMYHYVVKVLDLGFTPYLSDSLNLSLSSLYIFSTFSKLNINFT